MHLISYPPPCDCATECLGSVNLPFSCLFDIWMPCRRLGSEQEGLLEDFKDPPKTATAVDRPIRPPPGGLLDASKRLKTSLRRLQDGLRCPKKPLRGPKEASRGPQEPPRRPQDAPRRLQDTILVDFWKQNGSQLAPKSNQKSIPTLKAKNQLNASRLDFSWFSGVQVGSKNQ